MANYLYSPVDTTINTRVKKDENYSHTFKWRVVNISSDSQCKLQQEFHAPCGTEFTCFLVNNNGEMTFSVQMCKAQRCCVGNVLFSNCHGSILLAFEDVIFRSIKNTEMFSLNDLPDKELIITCCVKLKVSKVEIRHCRFQKTAEPPIEYLRKLSEDLTSLSQTALAETIDVRIGEETETISVDKAAICTRSSFFDAMFQSGMKENKDNVVILKDVDIQVFKMVVAFLYSGVVGRCSYETLCDLYCTADRFVFSQLRNACVDLLLERITVQSLWRVLLMSDQRNDTVLKNGVINYFNLYFEELIVTEDWRNVMIRLPKLALEVINFCRKTENLPLESKSSPNSV